MTEEKPTNPYAEEFQKILKEYGGRLQQFKIRLAYLDTWDAWSREIRQYAANLEFHKVDVAGSREEQERIKAENRRKTFLFMDQQKDNYLFQKHFFDYFRSRLETDMKMQG